MATKLVYMEDGSCRSFSTTVIEAIDATDVVLAETIFYPQGGGQPCDQGTITGSKGVFQVEQVRNSEGVVHHVGRLEGVLVAGEKVVCAVDSPRRELNSRLHSAGHVIDMAVRQVGLGWVPAKGYHFPDGPYVEYAGELDEAAKELLFQSIQAACDELVAKDLPVRIEFMSREAMEGRVASIPEHIPENRPTRVVFMGEYGLPCGGTHVTRLGEVGKIIVRKVKKNGESVRVGYQIA